MIKPNHKSSAGSSPNFTHHHHPSLMPQGKPISEDIQWIVVCLGAAFSSDDVAMYTNISERKVRAILAHHKRTGSVDAPKCGRPNLYRKLSEEDIKVCLSYHAVFTAPNHFTPKHLYGTLSSMPDVYLDELQQELKEKHGVSVATSTIWRALVRGGYSMKKVCSKLIDWAIMSDRL